VRPAGSKPAGRRAADAPSKGSGSLDRI